MAFTAFDPRDSIRNKIGTDWDIEDDGIIEKCIIITDNDNASLYIPMYFSEAIKSENLPTMPYIEMRMLKTYYLEHDVGATTRKMDSYIDLHVYITDTDNIDREACGKKVKDFLQNAIRTNQYTFTNIEWINVDSDDYLPEQSGSQLVYHYIMTIHCLHYDICTGL
jgi:hypothetical protein